MMNHEERVAQLVQADAAAPPNDSFDPALYSCRLIFRLRRERVFRANAQPAAPCVERGGLLSRPENCRCAGTIALIFARREGRLRVVASRTGEYPPDPRRRH